LPAAALLHLAGRQELNEHHQRPKIRQVPARHGSPRCLSAKMNEIPVRKMRREIRDCSKGQSSKLTSVDSISPTGSALPSDNYHRTGRRWMRPLHRNPVFIVNQFAGQWNGRPEGKSGSGTQATRFPRDFPIGHRLYSPKTARVPGRSRFSIRAPAIAFRGMRNCKNRGCTLTSKQTSEAQTGNARGSIPMDNKQACPRASRPTNNCGALANFCLPAPAAIRHLARRRPISRLFCKLHHRTLTTARPISIFIAHAGSINARLRRNRIGHAISLTRKRRELRQRDTMMSQRRSLSGYRLRTSGGRIQIGIRGEITRESFASCAARLGR